MVSTKDVSMEPTIRSLQDDLVGGQINDQYINEKNLQESQLPVWYCVSPSPFIILISLHSLSERPTNYGHFNKESGTFVQIYQGSNV